MSAVRIAKGYPKSLMISLNNANTSVNLNDGTWTVSANLCYQTKEGPSPFPLTLTPSANTVILNITSNQTSQLEHRGSGYVILINLTKNDNSTFIENQLIVNVTDGL